MYRGVGNRWRELSQLKLMTRLRDEYGIRSVLNAPYDHATDPEIDNQPFSRVTALHFLPYPHYGIGRSDLVWNFDFVQRQPSLLEGMIALSHKYVLAFVPNRYNGGQVIHALYHRLHGNACVHPEGGDPSLMTRIGIATLFRAYGLKVLECSGVDSAPWFDWVQPLGQFFTTPRTEHPETIYGGTPHLPVPKQLLAFEDLIKPLDLIWAHHCYCLGEKQDG